MFHALRQRRHGIVIELLRYDLDLRSHYVREGMGTMVSSVSLLDPEMLAFEPQGAQPQKATFLGGLGAIASFSQA